MIMAVASVCVCVCVHVVASCAYIGGSLPACLPIEVDLQGSKRAVGKMDPSMSWWVI